MVSCFLYLNNISRFLINTFILCVAVISKCSFGNWFIKMLYTNKNLYTTKNHSISWRIRLKLNSFNIGVTITERDSFQKFETNYKCEIFSYTKWLKNCVTNNNFLFLCFFSNEFKLMILRKSRQIFLINVQFILLLVFIYIYIYIYA